MDFDTLITSLYSSVKNPHNFILGPCDTDSISIGKPDGSPMTSEECTDILNEINGMLPNYIRYAHDGYFEKVLIIRAKNYALYDGKKIKIKGSALKATQKELALKEFNARAINILLGLDTTTLADLYKSYVHEIFNITDIKRWTSKKSISERVLNPERANEQKVLDSIKGTDYREGEKIRVFFRTDGTIALQEHWKNDHDPERLLEKLYKTVSVFETVVDMSQFLNYKLKRNKKALNELLGVT